MCWCVFPIENASDASASQRNSARLRLISGATLAHCLLDHSECLLVGQQDRNAEAHHFYMERSSINGYIYIYIYIYWLYIDYIFIIYIYWLYIDYILIIYWLYIDYILIIYWLYIYILIIYIYILIIYIDYIYILIIYIDYIYWLYILIIYWLYIDYIIYIYIDYILIIYWLYIDYILILYIDCIYIDFIYWLYIYWLYILIIYILIIYIDYIYWLYIDYILIIYIDYILIIYWLYIDFIYWLYIIHQQWLIGIGICTCREIVQCLIPAPKLHLSIDDPRSCLLPQDSPTHKKVLVALTFHDHFKRDIVVTCFYDLPRCINYNTRIPWYVYTYYIILCIYIYIYYIILYYIYYIKYYILYYIYINNIIYIYFFSHCLVVKTHQNWWWGLSKTPIQNLRSLRALLSISKDCRNFAESCSRERTSRWMDSKHSLDRSGSASFDRKTPILAGSLWLTPSL